jgi:Holliday junction resolvase RusA-like endonuclease
MSKQHLRWTTEYLMNHPKRDSLLGVNRKIQQPSTSKEPEKEIPAAPIPVVENVDKWAVHRFAVPGPPRGKPRMTRRDTWKKRPIVLRYREYCDRIRAAAGTLPANVYSVVVHAYIAMPESWSKKKCALMPSQLMQQKPDWDNIGKAVCDALFEEDSVLGGGTTWKFWCEPGQERTEIHVLYHK